MKIRKHYSLFAPVALASVALLAPTSFAQSPSEWSTQIWAAASDGQWETVDSLLNKVPAGEDAELATFKTHLATYRSNRTSEQEATDQAREEALEEMKTHLAEENLLQAMQLAVKAQTLSESLDDVMYNSDVQAVLSQAQRHVASLDQNENVLTAQTLLYYLRTFYEGTSRRQRNQY